MVEPVVENHDEKKMAEAPAKAAKANYRNFRKKPNTTLHQIFLTKP
jgi:hypothetical protein